MNVWLHRISHHAELSYPLLERGYLSIGFSGFSNEEFIRRTQESWDSFENAFEEVWKGRPRTRYNLWRFVAEMEEGDWVVVPSWREFSVYEITGEAALPGKVDVNELKTWNGEEVTIENGLFAVNGSEVDLGFVRAVKPIKVGMSRYDCADAELTKRMKIRQTNANITGLKGSVDKALKGPVNLHSRIVSYSRGEVLKLIQDELHPDKFEYLIKWYFDRLGASDVYVPAKNERDKEGDADIIATFEPLRTIYHVQAKHHKGVTSDWAVHQIHDYVDHRKTHSDDDGYAKIGWVVTSGDEFSKKSENLAKENSILLFTGHDLAQMILEVGIDNLDKAFDR